MLCVLLHLLEQLAHLTAVVGHLALPEEGFQLQKKRLSLAPGTRLFCTACSDCRQAGVGGGAVSWVPVFQAWGTLL